MSTISEILRNHPIAISIAFVAGLIANFISDHLLVIIGAAVVGYIVGLYIE